MKTTVIRHQINDEPSCTDYVICAKVAGETSFIFQSVSKRLADHSFHVEIGRPEALDYIREAAQNRQHAVERM